MRRNVNPKEIPYSFSYVKSSLPHEYAVMTNIILKCMYHVFYSIFLLCILS